MRTRVALGALAVFFSCVASSGASSDPYRDQAETIACPAAPAGWFNPPENAGGRSILTPLTMVEQTDDPSVIVGAPIVQVDCHYRTAAGKDLQVSVRYALPIDLNPWNDFYIGCTATGRPQAPSTAAHAWNARERVYRVVGGKTWSLATFIDDLNALRAGDVPRFESVTRRMLTSAQPFAHNCKLAGKGRPVDIESIWIFSFDIRTTSAGITSSGRSSGSFVARATTSGTGSLTVNSLHATDFRLSLRGKGKPRWLALHIRAPVEFRRGYGSILRTNVVVTGSTDGACRKGSTGTLLVSHPYLSSTRVVVRICGHTYLDGAGRVSARMQPV